MLIVGQWCKTLFHYTHAINIIVSGGEPLSPWIYASVFLCQCDIGQRSQNNQGKCGREPIIMVSKPVT